MKKHECMKCIYYLTHAGDIVICNLEMNSPDPQSFSLTLKFMDADCITCRMFRADRNALN